MSLVVSPQPDGSIIVSCGDYKVMIPPRGVDTAIAAPPIHPPGSGDTTIAVPPQPPELPVRRDGTVIVQLGPGPDGSVHLEGTDLGSIVDAILDNPADAPVELATWPEEGVDIEALMSAVHERRGDSVSIDLHFLSGDE